MADCAESAAHNKFHKRLHTVSSYAVNAVTTDSLATGEHITFKWLKVPGLEVTQFVDIEFVH